MSLLFDPYFLWTYGSSLETESPRFTRKGDFFLYVVFVEAVIVVCYDFQDILPRCALFIFPCSTILYLPHPVHSSYENLTYLPGQFTVAVTVPGFEGD